MRNIRPILLRSPRAEKLRLLRRNWQKEQLFPGPAVGIIVFQCLLFRFDFITWKPPRSVAAPPQNANHLATTHPKRHVFNLSDCKSCYSQFLYNKSQWRNEKTSNPARYVSYELALFTTLQYCVAGFYLCSSWLPSLLWFKIV